VAELTPVIHLHEHSNGNDVGNSSSRSLPGNDQPDDVELF
jgi:hypothetical protein